MHNQSFFETVKVMVLAVLLALFVRTVAFEPFSIPSASMVPSLLVGDYLFVSKYSYGYSRFSMPFSPRIFEGRIFQNAQPARGDVIVFRQPKNTQIDYIKRVIGLPGDTIQMREGRLYINGVEIQRERVEDYVYNQGSAVRIYARFIETLPGGLQHVILEQSDAAPLDNTPAFKVPPDNYFMMGDNRDDSKDSRAFDELGFVPAENIIARADMVFFSSGAPLWQIWRWPFELRWDRFFLGIH